MLREGREMSQIRQAVVSGEMRLDRSQGQSITGKGISSDILKARGMHPERLRPGHTGKPTRMDRTRTRCRETARAGCEVTCEEGVFRPFAFGRLILCLTLDDS